MVIACSGNDLLQVQAISLPFKIWLQLKVHTFIIILLFRSIHFFSSLCVSFQSFSISLVATKFETNITRSWKAAQK